MSTDSMPHACLPPQVHRGQLVIAAAIYILGLGLVVLGLTT